MKFQRWEIAKRIAYVSLDDDDRPLRMADTWGALLSGEGNPSRGILDVLSTPKARLLAPVSPSKVVCVGLNYRQHAQEMGKAIPERPLIFLKPSTAVIASGDVIEIPERSHEVHHEGELAVVIGRRARSVSRHEAEGVILGYTIMNDVTARDIQRRETKYTHAKGYDTFAPLGPIVADIDPDEVQLECRVNGEVRQSSGCDDMIFKVPELVEFISSIMTLLPGDIISTGTPFGVGPIVDGDTVSVSISGIGLLENKVSG